MQKQGAEPQESRRINSCFGMRFGYYPITARKPPSGVVRLAVTYKGGRQRSRVGSKYGTAQAFIGHPGPKLDRPEDQVTHKFAVIFGMSVGC